MLPDSSDARVYTMSCWRSTVVTYLSVEIAGKAWNTEIGKSMIPYFYKVLWTPERGFGTSSSVGRDRLMMPGFSKIARSVDGTYEDLF